MAQALDTTVEELLDGLRDTPAAARGSAAKKAPCAARSKQALRRRCAVGWLLFLLAGVLVCGICDLCTGGRGWALYPASCCALAGPAVFFLILRGARGIFASLLCLSGLIGPFLYALDRLIPKEASILPVGLAMAGLGLALLWGCYGAALRWRVRPLRAGAACAGLCLLACLAVNLTLARLLGIPLLDGWDLLVIMLLGVLAAALLWLDRHPARHPD